MSSPPFFVALAVAFVSALAAPAIAQSLSPSAPVGYDVSDATLVRSLPGFANRVAKVNGIRIHYVEGGKGSPVFLLPGWPETWWSFRKIMPELAKTHRVISVDLRGMGTSDKPPAGYDKKTMASDIAELARQLGTTKIDVIGHDIGSMVAFSLGANHPALVGKMVLLEGPHPTRGFLNLRLLPDLATFGDRIDEAHPYLWWFSFHQVKGMPEQLLEGRAQVEQAWFFRYMLRDDSAIDARSRAVYAAAYNAPGGTRAGNAWFQAFGQDIVDSETYGKLTIPVLGLSGVDFPSLKATLDATAPEAKTFRIDGSGHFIAEEKPAALLGYLRDFLIDADVKP